MVLGVTYRAAFLRAGDLGGAMPDLLEWLREQVADYSFNAVAILLQPPEDVWPLVAGDLDDLVRQLDDVESLGPLPREAAALANVIEASLVKFLTARLDELVEEGADVAHATAGERNYPDLEISGAYFSATEAPAIEAVDIKVARRSRSGTQTQSRITLYTGNTYFKWPRLHWPGNLRPFGDYDRHLDILVIYTLWPESPGRVMDVEVIVHPAWKIASKERSSTTREYIGAVVSLNDLRAGNGVFDTEEEFYAYWRSFPFRQSRQVTNILARLLDQQG